MCQDGTRPSGVASYGYSVLRRMADARMLMLNCDHAPPAAPIAVRSRIACLPTGVSHDVPAVAAAIARQVDAGVGKMVLLPNTGDTTWAATAQWIRETDRRERAQTRVVGIVHSDMDTQYRLAQGYADIAPVWIGVSQRCAHRLEQQTYPATVKVFKLSYPVDAGPAVRVPDNDRPLRLIYAGRLEEAQKRVSRLVALFTALHHRGIRFKATVAGDGPAKRQFAAMVAAATPDVGAMVDLPGPLAHHELQAIWADQDIFLLTSVYEGLPLALLEAMSAGLCPVVMAVRSGLSELLADGGNARIVKQGDVEGMADAIAELDRHRDRLNACGHAARKTVQAGELSPQQHFARLLEIVQTSFQFPPPVAAANRDPVRCAIDQMCGDIAATALPVVIFGAGMFGRKLVDACLAKRIPVNALIDSDPDLAGFAYRHLSCHPPDRLTAFTNCAVAIGSLAFTADIGRQIEAAFRQSHLPVPPIVRYRGQRQPNWPNVHRR